MQDRRNRDEFSALVTRNTDTVLATKSRLSECIVVVLDCGERSLR
jgi:hypothetical protein